MNNNLSIGRGWTVVTADRKRVGDVTEVHPHYLLVSRGVVLVRDMYLPLGAVDHIDGTTVILSITQQVLRGMDLAHEPAPLPEAEPLQDPTSTSTYVAPSYEPEPVPSEPLAFPGSWEGEQPAPYEDMPTYARAQPNGLIEIEHGLNIAFQDLGYGDTIVLLQGWPFDSTIWEPLSTILANDYRIITYDPRGTGGSDRPWDPYGVESFAQDLHRLIIEQALHDVTLVAWSSAAPIALSYAREHQGRLARLVLLNPLIPTWLAEEKTDDSPPSALDGAAQDEWGRELLESRPEFFERLIDRLTHEPLSEPRRQWLWSRLMLGALHAQLKSWESLRGYDLTFTLSQVQAPVTILSGEHDHLSPPALGARLAEALPRAQALTIGECGHAIFLEQREAIIKVLSDLIDTAPLPTEGTLVPDDEIPQSWDEQPQLENEQPLVAE